MTMISTADLNKKSQRELGAIKQQILKDLGNCERNRRHHYAALAQIRNVQARKVMRPNL